MKRSRVVARATLAAALVLSVALPMALHAADPQPADPQGGDKPAATGLWGKLKKAGGDISTGVKQGTAQATDNKGVVGKVSSDVQDNLAGKVPQVVGYVNLGNGQFMTYFDNSRMGFPSHGALLAVPPKPGTVPPAMMLAPTGRFQGTLIPNNIDEAIKAGVYHEVAAAAPPGATAPGKPAAQVVAVQEAVNARGNVQRNAPDNCRVMVEYDAAGNEIGRHSLHSDLDFDMAGICETRTFDMQRGGIRDVSPTGSTTNAAAGTAAGGPSRQDRIKAIQADSSAKFAAIQGQAAASAAQPAAAAAPASDDDLAEQAATVCKLKAVQAYKLKDQALQFVRYDRKADRVIMSEYSNGARNEVSLDGAAFGQRSMALGKDVGAGGETCGRAFWGNEAIKAATAAFSN